MIIHVHVFLFYVVLKKTTQTKYYTNTISNSVAVVLITSIISKICERIFYETRSISPHQHSFLPSQPCLSNVLAFEEAVTRMMGEDHIADVIYLNFGKAFEPQISFGEKEVLRSW